MSHRVAREPLTVAFTSYVVARAALTAAFASHTVERELVADCSTDHVVDCASVTEARAFHVVARVAGAARAALTAHVVALVPVATERTCHVVARVDDTATSVDHEVARDAVTGVVVAVYATSHVVAREASTVPNIDVEPLTSPSQRDAAEVPSKYAPAELAFSNTNPSKYENFVLATVGKPIIVTLTNAVPAGAADEVKVHWFQALAVTVKVLEPFVLMSPPCAFSQSKFTYGVCAVSSDQKRKLMEKISPATAFAVPYPPVSPTFIDVR
jgi:hypothetical protein